jgi:hypothetical protein
MALAPFCTQVGFNLLYTCLYISDIIRFTCKTDIIRLMYIGHRVYRMKITDPLEFDIREDYCRQNIHDIGIGGSNIIIPCQAY